jgi:hypothetical protein
MLPTSRTMPPAAPVTAPLPPAPLVMETLASALPALIAPPAMPALPLAPPQASHALSLRGEYWVVRHNGRTSIVEDCRGLRYIALLIRDGQGDKGPIHAKELVALATGQPSEAIELEIADPVLDAAARTQLMKRLEEIAFERARAEDDETAAALDEEYERVADALGQDGAGRGRKRGTTFNSAGEKARKAVGKAISEAIARIASCPDVSELAEHLAVTVRKGLWLSYGGTLAWEIEFDAARRRP